MIYYYSVTGNIKKYLTGVDLPCVDIRNITPSVDLTSFILITPTTGLGEVPAQVSLFMHQYHKFCKGVVGSGNKNWGLNYCKSVDILQRIYQIPVLFKFELSGNSGDQQKLKEWHDKLFN